MKISFSLSKFDVQTIQDEHFEEFVSCFMTNSLTAIVKHLPELKDTEIILTVGVTDNTAFISDFPLDISLKILLILKKIFVHSLKNYIEKYKIYFH